MRDLIPRSVGKIARFPLALALLLISAQQLPAPIFELPEKPPQAPGIFVRADGSRHLYEVDKAHRRATSTITERDGKLRVKIQYELDAAGRFASRAVLTQMASSNPRLYTDTTKQVALWSRLSSETTKLF